MRQGERAAPAPARARAALLAGRRGALPAAPRLLRRASVEAGAAQGDGPHEPRVPLTEPLGPLDFLQLLGGAHRALTVSGGIREETAVSGVPA